MSAHEDKIKNLWQNLPTSGTIYTPAQLNQRASRFQAKIKRRNLIEYVSWAVLFALTAYVNLQNPSWGNGILSGLTVLGAIIAITNYRRLAHGKSGSAHPSNDSLIKHMRTELTLQRDAAATQWRWYGLPFAPAIIFLTIYRWSETSSNFAVLTDDRISILLGLGTVVTIFAAITFWYWLQAAKYQRQLDDLNRYTS